MNEVIVSKPFDRLVIAGDDWRCRADRALSVLVRLLERLSPSLSTLDHHLELNWIQDLDLT